MDFNDDTNTSVGLAARLGNVVLLKELLQHGHPTNGPNNKGWHPLHEAAAGGHVECVRLLLEADDAKVDVLTDLRLTALYLACEPGECYTEVVKLLLRAGADPNMICGDNWELLLSKAVLKNLYDIVKLLLDAGGNPNRRDCLKSVPLMAAAEKGHLKIAQLLVERGAKVDFRNDMGSTAIHYLLEPKHHLMEDSTLIPFINLLVNGGLDVNAQTSDGTTPLMRAIEENKVGAVSRLLELWADPNIKKDFGVLALHYAIQFFPDYSTECSNSEGKTTDHVLRRILDLTSREVVIPAKLQKIDYSIFHLAVEWERFNTVKLMVNAGLPPDAFLQELVEADDDQCLDETDMGLYCQVPMLIDLGIEVSTPLGYLLNMPLNKTHVEIAKFMIEKGSNVNVAVPRCLPPLVAAVTHQQARYNHGCPGLDILEHLLNNSVDVMHKISAMDILPAALQVSSLFNAQAFFALIVRCIAVHEIYTPWTLESLSQLYAKYYKKYPLWPWKVISWLNVVNAFVPQLPLDTKIKFDIQRMFEDDNLSKAWDDLDAQIGSPKKLEHLCILTVRRVVGERRDWNQLTTFLQKLTLMNEPLPDLIVDLLTFKQMESSCLSKWPPREVLSRYNLPAANSRNANRTAAENTEMMLYEAMNDNEDGDDNEDEEDDLSLEDNEDDLSLEDDEDDLSLEDDDEEDIEMMYEAMDDIEDGDASDDYEDEEDDDDDDDDGDDGICDKEDDEKEAEQNDNSVKEEEENKRKKINMKNE